MQEGKDDAGNMGQSGRLKASTWKIHFTASRRWAVHEGHYIKHGNKYVKNVNRYRVYKTGKTVGPEEVKGWCALPT